MDEIVSFDELYNAYLDCRKHKRNTAACADFELDEAANLFALWEELNNGTYEIGTSDAFGISRPKDREVFAADFKDRIVHHLLILRIGGLFEADFDNESYSCRKGKGNLFGAKRLRQQLREFPPDAWGARVDMSGFFMSIYKPLLCKFLTEFLRENYKGENADFWISLAVQIAAHHPELNCRIKGDIKILKRLAHGKTLFDNEPECGLAIGNLTSQIFANFFMSKLEKWLRKHFQNIRFGRYVDDVYLIARTKRELLECIAAMRVFLREELRVKLHPYKVYLQPVRHGMDFTGFTVKKGRIYTGKRTVAHFYDLAYRQRGNRAKEETIEHFAAQYNSLSGFTAHTAGYNIRVKVWSLVDEETKKYITITPDFRVTHVRPEYLTKTKLLKYYAKSKLSKRGVDGNGRCTRIGLVRSRITQRA